MKLSYCSCSVLRIVGSAAASLRRNINDMHEMICDVGLQLAKTSYLFADDTAIMLGSTSNATLSIEYAVDLERV